MSVNFLSNDFSKKNSKNQVFWATDKAKKFLYLFAGDELFEKNCETGLKGQ